MDTGKLSSDASIGIPINLSLMLKGHYITIIYMTTSDMHTLLHDLNKSTKRINIMIARTVQQAGLEVML